MRFAAVICEYNPFHRGHLYQLNRIKDSFDGVICVMSGDAVQRGDFAVAGKYLRARAALECGADLVLELPAPWCCAS
ncbi:MAG: nucleotidyltransferase family protein, partial [Clostridia bacterium]|nr:nucleotidyltransferase family protein [Clostridia bacterium]